ncbi:MAG: SBBP repeat-containing protein, partial [bacterium]|nr:SBBP repeat-containing protein [bacterium]
TGLADMLDVPLLITVTQDHPAASYGFTFGAESNDRAMGIGTDPEGRVYVTGDFLNTVDFDPGEDVHEMTAIRRSGYVVKYDQDDFLVLDSAHWDGGHIGNDNEADVDSFSSDGIGQFYITGTSQYNPANPRAAYIRSVTPSNLENWVIYVKDWSYFDWIYGEGSCEYDYSSVACGNDGNIYYYVNTDLYGKPWPSLPPGSYLCATLVKRTPSGITEVFLDQDDTEFINRFNSVEVNQYGVFTFVHNWSDEAFIRYFSMNGTFQWELGFGPQEITQYAIADSDDLGNVYFIGFNGSSLTKILPSGLVLLELSWDAQAEDLFITEDNSVLVTGTFTETVDFDPGDGTTYRSSPGTTSGYVSAFDSDGNFQWVETWGTSEEMYSESITADSNGNIYVCGYFAGSIDLGPPGESDWHTSNGGLDAFVLKLSH